MPSKRYLVLAEFTVLVVVALFTAAFTQSAQAQAQDTPAVTNDNCLTCHENLYFLHDTGNWYCLRESPMTCSQCHGGNPGALTQEEAHIGRAAHPVLNEDISKCQECHPEKCDERVDLFSQVAGIDEVRVAEPSTSAPPANEPAVMPFQDQPTFTWINLLEILPIVVVAGAALIVYGVYFLRHGR